MQTITTIGLDIAKSVFQAHGVDAAGQVVIRLQLKRRYVLAFFEKLSPCLAVAAAIACCRGSDAGNSAYQCAPPDDGRLYAVRSPPDVLTPRLNLPAGGRSH